MSEHADQISGRIAVITGAGRGIGRAIGHRLAALGAGVVLASRSSKEISDARDGVLAAGGKAISVAADVSTPAGAQRLADAARAEFGRIDYLINNAGQAVVGTIAQLSVEDFDRMLAVNVRAVFLCCRALWADLARHQGAIINISSVAAADPFPGLGAYGATKAFVNLYTKVLADEGAASGIRAYGIAPGAVETEMLRGSFPDYPSEQTLRPGDIADLAITLLSPSCRHSSGQVITIQKR